jgi:hypothetical protein
VVIILKQASDKCPPAILGADIQIIPALLLKEAAYNVVGAAYYDLYDCTDFKSWCVIHAVVIFLRCLRSCMLIEHNETRTFVVIPSCCLSFDFLMGIVTVIRYPLLPRGTR